MQYHTLVVSKLARPQTMFPIALCTYLILKQEVVKYGILLLNKNIYNQYNHSWEETNIWSNQTSHIIHNKHGNNHE